jgi:hypothetical protein
VDEVLRNVVEAQARALIEGDMATFASYAAPSALPALYRRPRPESARGFQIVDVSDDGTHGHSEVRFGAADNYTMRGVWQRSPAGWKAISFDIPPIRPRAPWWKSLFRARAPHPEREDLS